MKADIITQQSNNLEPDNLCSRKLWELLLQNDDSDCRESIFTELKKRNHYQREIEQLLPRH